MNTEVLRKIGLTEGEIRVYESLANLGKSSTGPIMDKSGISSSKVYLILEKLVKKGLVSFIMEDNVKKFQITNPRNLIEYLDKKQDELEKTKNEAESFVEELNSMIGNHEEESAQIYKGLPGMKSVYRDLLEDIGEGGEYLFFARVKERIENQNLETFFKNLHKKRIEKNIKVRSIVGSELKDQFKKRYANQKFFEARYSDLPLPMSVTIGRSMILSTMWEDNPICFQIISKRIAQRYKEFFEKYWKTAKR